MSASSFELTCDTGVSTEERDIESRETVPESGMMLVIFVSASIPDSL